MYLHRAISDRINYGTKSRLLDVFLRNDCVTSDERGKRAATRRASPIESLKRDPLFFQRSRGKSENGTFGERRCRAEKTRSSMMLLSTGVAPPSVLLSCAQCALPCLIHRPRPIVAARFYRISIPPARFEIPCSIFNLSSGRLNI